MNGDDVEQFERCEEHPGIQYCTIGNTKEQRDVYNSLFLRMTKLNK